MTRMDKVFIGVIFYGCVMDTMQSRRNPPLNQKLAVMRAHNKETKSQLVRQIAIDLPPKDAGEIAHDLKELEKTEANCDFKVTEVNPAKNW